MIYFNDSKPFLHYIYNVKLYHTIYKGNAFQPILLCNRNTQGIPYRFRIMAKSRPHQPIPYKDDAFFAIYFLPLICCLIQN